MRYKPIGKESVLKLLNDIFIEVVIEDSLLFKFLLTLPQFFHSYTDNFFAFIFSNFHTIAIFTIG